jgi:hypothetical protein
MRGFWGGLRGGRGVIRMFDRFSVFCFLFLFFCGFMVYVLCFGELELGIWN